MSHEGKIGRFLSNERVEVYEKATQLRKNGLGPSRISRLLDVPKSTLCGWFYANQHPLGWTHQFSTKPSEALSYVIGVYLGDGTAYYNKTSQCYRVALKVKDRKFAESFSKNLARVVGRNKPYKVIELKGGLYSVEVGSYVLFNFLKQSLAKLWSVIKAFPQEFIRGFYESEGCFIIQKYYWNIKKEKHHRKTFQFHLKMSNLNKELLLIVKKLMEPLGFHPTLVGPYKACKLYEVCLSRTREVKSFIRTIRPCIKIGGV